jgi:hypothetical protein
VDLGVPGKKEAKDKIYLLSPSWFNHPGRSRKIARGDQGKGGNQIDPGQVLVQLEARGVFGDTSLNVI